MARAHTRVLLYESVRLRAVGDAGLVLVLNRRVLQSLLLVVSGTRQTFPEKERVTWPRCLPACLADVVLLLPPNDDGSFA